MNGFYLTGFRGRDVLRGHQDFKSGQQVKDVMIFCEEVKNLWDLLHPLKTEVLIESLKK